MFRDLYNWGGAHAPPLFLYPSRGIGESPMRVLKTNKQSNRNENGKGWVAKKKEQKKFLTPSRACVILLLPMTNESPSAAATITKLVKLGFRVTRGASDEDPTVYLAKSKRGRHLYAQVDQEGRIDGWDSWDEFREFALM